MELKSDMFFGILLSVLLTGNFAKLLSLIALGKFLSEGFNTVR